MRTNVHDQSVKFRVNGDLIALASAKARLEGMSLSELFRAALRAKIFRVEDEVLSGLRADTSAPANLPAFSARIAGFEDRLTAIGA